MWSVICLLSTSIFQANGRSIACALEVPMTTLKNSGPRERQYGLTSTFTGSGCDVVGT